MAETTREEYYPMARPSTLPCFLLFLACTQASAESHPQSDQEKFSYTIGVQMARNLLNQSLDLDREAFMQGLEDALREQGLKLSQDEMRQALVAYQQAQQARRSQSASRNLQQSQTFLEENSRKEGIEELPSGVQYQVLREGNGEQPSGNDNVRVHYEGRLIDGTVFDSSYERGEPVSLNLDQVIEGWQIALPLMSVGSKWQLFIPPELGYGEAGAGADIGPNAALIFTVELLAIN